MSIIFHVLGDPRAQKRHRHFTRGKFTRTYDPSRSSKADFLAIAQQHAPEHPFIRPVKLTITFYFRRPLSHYNKHGVKPSAPDWHHIRPDVDNLSKFVMDALNGVYWRDDAQVCDISAIKRYSTTPMTVVEIEAVQE